LRLRSVSHLGQIEQAIIETNGEISVFYVPDEEVRYGLPIIPGRCEEKLEAISKEDYYACTYCGNAKKLVPAPSHSCDSCGRTEWLKATNEKRIK
jgi:uncharacterized membrane protein YcaP (DUF421 family)